MSVLSGDDLSEPISVEQLLVFGDLGVGFAGYIPRPLAELVGIQLFRVDRGRAGDRSRSCYVTGVSHPLAIYLRVFRDVALYRGTNQYHRDEPSRVYTAV